MSSVSYIAKPIANPRDAIASHIRWKITLLTAAKMRETLSERATRAIEHPEEDSIRRWLLSEQTLPLRGTAEYAAALSRHTEFHQKMQAVARMLNSGEFAEAERLQAPNSEFERASVAVAGALMALGRVKPQVLAS